MTIVIDKWKVTSNGTIIGSSTNGIHIKTSEIKEFKTLSNGDVLAMSINGQDYLLKKGYKELKIEKSNSKK